MPTWSLGITDGFGIYIAPFSPSHHLYSKCMSRFTKLNFSVLSEPSRPRLLPSLCLQSFMSIFYVDLFSGSSYALWAFPKGGMSSPLHLRHYRVSSGQLITRSNCIISVLIFLNLMAAAYNFFKMLLKFSLDFWDIFFPFNSFESCFSAFYHLNAFYEANFIDGSSIISSSRSMCPHLSPKCKQDVLIILIRPFLLVHPDINTFHFPIFICRYLSHF